MGEGGRDSDLEDLVSGVDEEVEEDVAVEEGGATAVATLLGRSATSTSPVPVTWGESTGGLRASLGGGGRSRSVRKYLCLFSDGRSGEESL